MRTDGKVLLQARKGSMGGGERGEGLGALEEVLWPIRIGNVLAYDHNRGDKLNFSRLFSIDAHLHTRIYACM